MDRKFKIAAIIFSLLCVFSFSNCSNSSTNNVLKNKVDSSYFEKPISLNVYPDYIEFIKGKSLFMSDCRSCHVSKNMHHNFLEGIVQRVGIDYLKLYLTRQDSLLTANEVYAKTIKEEYGNMGNSHNFSYSEVQLNELIEYLK